MNKKHAPLIIFPLLILASCYETSSSETTSYPWNLKYDEFLSDIKSIGYRKVIKDGVYQYNESVISDDYNSSLLLCGDLSFYDAFNGTCSAFYSSFGSTSVEKEVFKEWKYDGVYFNYHDILVDLVYTATGKYGKEVNFNFNFNLKPFYQLFCDDKFESLTFIEFDAWTTYRCFTVIFKEEYIKNEIRIEEYTSLYFNYEDFSFAGITQSKNIFNENDQMIRVDTKSLLSSNDDKINIGQIEKTEDYIDLSTTCLPNVRF